MIVLSDASPLIHLSKLQRLDLLGSLFHEVLAAEAVHDEILAGKEATDAEAIVIAAFIRFVAARDADSGAERDLAGRFRIGRGEAATLSAAQRLSAELVLMDDR